MHRIIISRTDSIGDVVLTLPMAGAIKQNIADSQIIFLGRDYVRPVVETSTYVDVFLSADEIFSLTPSLQKEKFWQLRADVIIHVFPNKKIASLAQKVKIPNRIGTSHRPYHWLNCNKMISLGRKNSNLHEVLLNLKLLTPLGIKVSDGLDEIPGFYGMTKIPPLSETIKNILSDDKANIILHPVSKGSAREWGLDNFSALINELSDRFNIIITGSADDKNKLETFLSQHQEKIVDTTGKISLSELIMLIAGADILVASSTGPLHIAAALGKKAIGIYAPLRPIHPGRWAPLGVGADYLVLDKSCNDCRNSSICQCIRSITPAMVREKINKAWPE